METKTGSSHSPRRVMSSGHCLGRQNDTSTGTRKGDSEFYPRCPFFTTKVPTEVPDPVGNCDNGNYFQRRVLVCCLSHPLPRRTLLFGSPRLGAKIPRVSLLLSRSHGACPPYVTVNSRTTCGRRRINCVVRVLFVERAENFNSYVSKSRR